MSLFLLVFNKLVESYCVRVSVYSFFVEIVLKNDILVEKYES